MSKHYKSGIETIEIMEQVMTQPGELPPKERMLVAQALKYLLRAGVKEGVSWQQDMLKALDYVHRTATGRWWHTKPAEPTEAPPPRMPAETFSELVSRALHGLGMGRQRPGEAVETWALRVIDTLADHCRAVYHSDATPEDLRALAAEMSVRAWEIETGTKRPCDPGAQVRLRPDDPEPCIEGEANVWHSGIDWYIQVGPVCFKAEQWEIL